MLPSLEQSHALTPNELIRKRQLEAQIRMHLDSFWKCGDALFEMRESKLFRDEYPTFEAYCDDKWHFSDRHARRLIFASQVVGQIGPVGPEIKERQIREFAPLEPDQYQPTWAQVVEAAKDNKVTASLVRRVVKAATSVTIEVVQTQGNVSISESSIPLIEAGITERIQEDMQRQRQHIADRTGQSKPLAVFEAAIASINIETGKIELIVPRNQRHKLQAFQSAGQGEIVRNVMYKVHL